MSDPLCVLASNNGGGQGVPGVATLFLSREGAAALRKALDLFEDLNCETPVEFPVKEGQNWNWVMLKPSTPQDFETTATRPCTCGCQAGFPPPNLDPLVMPSRQVFHAFLAEDSPFAALLDNRESMTWPGGTFKMDHGWVRDWHITLEFDVPLPKTDQLVHVKLALRPCTSREYDEHYSYETRILGWDRDTQIKTIVTTADGTELDVRAEGNDPLIPRGHKKPLLDSIRKKREEFNAWAKEAGLPKALILHHTRQHYESATRFRQGWRDSTNKVQPQIDACLAVLRADDPEALYAANVKLITRNPAAGAFGLR